MESTVPDTSGWFPPHPKGTSNKTGCRIALSQNCLAATKMSSGTLLRKLHEQTYVVQFFWIKTYEDNTLGEDDYNIFLTCPIGNNWLTT